MITTTPYYDKTYLHDAMENLGSMFDYAINDCHYDAEDFFDLFIASGVAWNIELGNPKFLAGMSGVETARDVLRRTGSKCDFALPTFPEQRSPEYWMGWALTYLQWHTGRSFSQLREQRLGPLDLLRLYPAMHEADLSKLNSFAESISIDIATQNLMREI